jgi:hypothetical protein
VIPPLGGAVRKASRVLGVSGAAAAAVALVVLEALVSWINGPFAAGPFFLLCACGLAFVPFAPPELRRPSIVVPLVPVVAVAIAPLALVSTATFGVPLTSTSVRVAVLLLTLAALGLSALPAFRHDREQPARGDWRRELPTLVLIAAILVLGAALYDGVIGGAPVPGEDWGHYLLYAQQVADQHAMLIDNPFSIGGRLAFSQDPDAPSLYAAFLLVGGETPGALVHGIELFSLLGILAMFVFVGALWGSEAGLVAAGLWAVLPAVLDILSWHGLATEYALVMFPLAAMCVGFACRGRLEWRWAFLLALSGAALLGAHRMTALVAGAVLAPALAFAILRRPRPGGRFLVMLLAFGLVVGGGLTAHTVRLLDKTGQDSDYRRFLVRKVQWDYTVRDITWVVVIVGAIGLVAMVLHRRTRRDPALLVLVGMAVGSVALSYAWVVHFPLDYVRTGTYLAIPLVAAFGAAWAQFLPRQALVLALVPVLLVARDAHNDGPNLRAFYQLADLVSLRGLDLLHERVRSSSAPIVTDQCWAFLVPWLLQHRAFAGFEGWTIPFRQDLQPARRARLILYGGEPGRELARRMGVRYVVLNPKCSSWSIDQSPVTIRGRPIYASTRLLILELPRKLSAM